ncbi:MAG: hypothetical protein ACOCUH_02310 [Bacteriovoracia bacterium]
MKNLEKNSSLSKFNLLIALLLALGSTSLFARAVVKVDKVKGNVFVVENGHTRLLRSGDEVNDLAEIMSSENGKASFRDYHDHQFHLSSSGHIKLLNKIIELKAGHLWVDSYNPHESFSIHTSNSQTDYDNDNFIVSFDSYYGKTQVMVLQGELQFSNIMQPELGTNVSSGYFSLIDKDYNKGIPRYPTVMGYKSFKILTTMFDKASLEKHETPTAILRTKKSPSRGRAIASAGTIERVKPTTAIRSKSKGEIILLKSSELSHSRKPASFSTEKFYKKEMDIIKKKKLARNPRYFGKKSKVSVNIFGKKSNSANVKKVDVNKYSGLTSTGYKRLYRIFASKKGTKKKVSNKEKSKDKNLDSLLKDLNGVASKRTPASVGTTNDTDVFTKSLEREYQNQKRHPKEVNSLIKELRSYKQDFQQEY